MKLSEACFISTVETRFNVSNFYLKIIIIVIKKCYENRKISKTGKQITEISL